jgi:AdoMet-dependent heme synthase
MDFNESPLLVIWEVTKACDLTCNYCRDSVLKTADPQELTTDEGFALLNDVKQFGNPLLVLSGGDPLKRPDIFDLIEQSVATGLRTNITPSPTPLLTTEAISRFQQSGISRMAMSLDGPDAPTQDHLRGVEGTYERTLLALRHALSIGLETQVHTTVSRGNLATLGHIAEQVAEVKARMWSLFFPVSAGCGMEQEDLSAQQYEKVFEFLFEISKVAPFEVKTTEALHYRRYIAQRLMAEHGGRGGANGRMLWRTSAVSDGSGFVFISHTGEIYPSGFLPVSGGNVRADSLVDVYQSSTLFRSLRDGDAREGKCGFCEFHKICGGSRARAYAMSGNYLESDPRCSYQPAQTHA